MIRTAYFFLRGNPIQFKVTAILTVCWDLGECPMSDIQLTLAVVSQRFMYGSEQPHGAPIEGEDEPTDGLDRAALRVGDDR